MTDPDMPLTTRGVPRTRFDPLRDAPGAKKAENRPDDEFLADLESENADLVEKRVLDVVSAVRRQIIALGLAETPEGAQAVNLAEKAMEATGSAAAACHHTLRMLMNEIKTSKPVVKPQDATEDVLSRRRERKAGG